jgi:NAD(P)-dependent dehydrogenase (short-subunit alcohol dehydrogenase family)
MTPSARIDGASFLERQDSMGSLDGKVAIVTGASRGIGKQTALRLGAAGATVVVHYRNRRDDADAVVRAIEAGGGTAFALQTDFSDPAGPRTFYERLDPELERRFGSNRFDILVNNAGAGTRVLIEDVSEELLDETLQVDLKAPFFLIKHASARLRDGGRIVNVSSMGTRVAYPEMAAYSAAKGGLEALTLMLAPHFGPRGITVNAVLPGNVITEGLIALGQGYMDTMAASVPLKRLGTVEDIGNAAAFLASKEAAYITGQTIIVDGGPIVPESLEALASA